MADGTLNRDFTVNIGRDIEFAERQQQQHGIGISAAIDGRSQCKNEKRHTHRVRDTHTHTHTTTTRSSWQPEKNCGNLCDARAKGHDLRSALEIYQSEVIVCTFGARNDSDRENETTQLARKANAV